MRGLVRSTLVVSSVAMLIPLTGNAATAAPGEFQTVEIVAEGMCCQGCVRKVSGKLYAAKGVRSVSADLPTHLVKVQAPKAGEAYLGSLWEAVAAGDGAPTSLTASGATFRLKQTGEASVASSATEVRVEGLETEGQLRQLASRFNAVEGVANVQVDPSRLTLVVTTAQGRQLNPWAAAELVVRAGHRPLNVSGPAGTLTIEWGDAKPLPAHNANLRPLGGISR